MPGMFGPTQPKSFRCGHPQMNIHKEHILRSAYSYSHIIYTSRHTLVRRVCIIWCSHVAYPRQPFLVWTFFLSRPSITIDMHASFVTCAERVHHCVCIGHAHCTHTHTSISRIEFTPRRTKVEERIGKMENEWDWASVYARLRTVNGKEREGRRKTNMVSSTDNAYVATRICMYVSLCML